MDTLPVACLTHEPIVSNDSAITKQHSIITRHQKGSRGTHLGGTHLLDLLALSRPRDVRRELCPSPRRDFHPHVLSTDYTWQIPMSYAYQGKPEHTKTG